MKLYQTLVLRRDAWVKTRKSIYVVAENKDAAKAYVCAYLVPDYKVVGVRELGEQLATYMYAGKLRRQ